MEALLEELETSYQIKCNERCKDLTKRYNAVRVMVLFCGVTDKIRAEIQKFLDAEAT
jgi:hypothetical protein